MAIRTKTILEVKQLEREQALKDSFAIADSLAKQKLPEIVSVPQSSTTSNSSINDSTLSSILEHRNFSSSFVERFNTSTNQSLPTSEIESSHMSVSDVDQSSISDAMTSLEPSSVFSSMDSKINHDIFTRMDSFDILNSLDLDINTDSVVDEISGTDVFLNEQNSQSVDIDLTSDNIDFLEINSDELIDLSQNVIQAFPVQSTDSTEGQSIQHHDIDSKQQFSPSTQSSSPSNIQQLSPASLDESMSSQFGSPSEFLVFLKNHNFIIV